MLKINGGEVMRKGDLIIGVVVLVIMSILGVGYYFYINSMGDERYVNIYLENKLYHSIELTSETDEFITVESEYGINKIHIYNNGFEVIYADCPDKDDVREGFVNLPGYAVICLPNKLKIIIEDNNFDGPDGYSS